MVNNKYGKSLHPPFDGGKHQIIAALFSMHFQSNAAMLIPLHKPLTCLSGGM